MVRTNRRPPLKSESQTGALTNFYTAKTTTSKYLPSSRETKEQHRGCTLALVRREKKDEATFGRFFQEKTFRWRTSLPVSLGHTLDLVLLLDGVRVGRSTGSVDDFIGEALGDGLDVAERRLARAGGDQVQSLMMLSRRHKTRKGRHMISALCGHTMNQSDLKTLGVT